ncbi:DEAD/DEAH box helicase [Spirochaetia bacterium]|nr:DEAD/DEAH box helicase [Spirochaetia bacterium]
MADTGHLIVKARTGTGKTAAFGIPLVEKIKAGGHIPRALILTPTRELALQVSREIASLVSGPYPRLTAVYGGASIRSQILDLKRGTEVVVGTPGRIMDLMDRKVLDLSGIDWFILDEADEMLDMGFFEDVEKILQSVKAERRVALFSATMPEPILRVIREYLGKVDILEDTAPDDEKPAVDQFYMVLKKEDRLEALRRIIDGSEEFYGLIFCATKIGADELSRRLVEGGYPAEAIHGDLSQEARERTLRRFRSRLTTILAATDVAARGLDIERLTHVVNWDMPNDRETYIHRIGRTGRAGRRGKAVSLALPAERAKLEHLSRSMEKTLGSRIQWMRVPSVKSVMKALRLRIVQSVAGALPLSDEEPVMEDGLLSPGEGVQTPAQTQEQTELAPVDKAAGEGLEASVESATEEFSPFLAKVCRSLIERMGAERAVTALVSLSYGTLLDPSRYGAVTEFPEYPVHEEGRNKFGGGSRHAAFRHGVHGNVHSNATHSSAHGSRHNTPHNVQAEFSSGGSVRLYVGLGKKHGATAKDLAGLLMKAGGVPGRLVDAIEIKDYCTFASLPEDAARRACTFSGKNSGEPVIRVASPKGRG